MKINLPTITEEDEEDILNFGLKKGSKYKDLLKIKLFNFLKEKIY